MIAAWLRAFVLTQALEVPVALLLLRGQPWRRVVAAALLATTVTHPVLWWVAPSLFPTYWSWVIVGELVVCAAEGLVYRLCLPRLPPWVALGVAMQVNAVSYLIGALLELGGR